MRTNQKIGRWTLSKEYGKSWTCVCDCGNTRKVLTKNLAAGSSLSCGCLRQQIHRSLMASAFPRREALHGLR